MFLSIIGAVEPNRYRLLDNKINELIQMTDCYLFTILCGYIEGNRKENKTLGEIWAKNNGAPILYIHASTTEQLIKKLFSKTDYAIFILDGDPFINNLFMQYKMLGKHGSVIKVVS